MAEIVKENANEFSKLSQLLPNLPIPLDCFEVEIRIFSVDFLLATSSLRKFCVDWISSKWR